MEYRLTGFRQTGLSVGTLMRPLWLCQVFCTNGSVSFITVDRSFRITVFFEKVSWNSEGPRRTGSNFRFSGVVNRRVYKHGINIENMTTTERKYKDMNFRIPAPFFRKFKSSDTRLGDSPRHPETLLLSIFEENLPLRRVQWVSVSNRLLQSRKL